jgi:hypothetical protein
VSVYEGWAVVAFFGHTKLAGKISEVQQYGVTMLCLEIPEVDGVKAFSVFKAGASIFDITPVSQEVAEAFVRGLRPAPVSWHELQYPPALAAAPADAELVGGGDPSTCVGCGQVDCVCEDGDDSDGDEP